MFFHYHLNPRSMVTKNFILKMESFKTGKYKTRISFFAQDSSFKIS